MPQRSRPTPRTAREGYAALGGSARHRPVGPPGGRHRLPQVGQEHDDVLKSHRLQGATRSEGGVVLGQRPLGSLARTRHLVEHPAAVEVLQGGHPTRVGKRENVAPIGVSQALQRVRDDLRLDRFSAVDTQRVRHLFRTDVDREPLLLCHERAHDAPVDRRVGCAEVGEGTVRGPGAATRSDWQVGHGSRVFHRHPTQMPIPSRPRPAGVRDLNPNQLAPDPRARGRNHAENRGVSWGDRPGFWPVSGRWVQILGVNATGPDQRFRWSGPVFLVAGAGFEPATSGL